MDFTNAEMYDNVDLSDSKLVHRLCYETYPLIRVSLYDDDIGIKIFDFALFYSVHRSDSGRCICSYGKAVLNFCTFFSNTFKFLTLSKLICFQG